MRFDLKLKGKYVFVVFFIILIISVGTFAYTYQQSIPNPGHGSDNVWIFLNGGVIDLQTAISGGLLNGTVQSGSYSPLNVSSGHSGNEILVKSNGVEKTLQSAIDDGSLCCKGCVASSEGYSIAIVEGHSASGIIIANILGVEKTLQQAIDDGEFCKYSLTVTRDGVGTSAVSSAPGNIACGSNCVANYVKGTTVSLTATPAQHFAQWTGSCSGSSSSCSLVIGSDSTVGARFNPYCGDGACNGGETCSSCSGDCGGCPPPPGGGGGGGS